MYTAPSLQGSAAASWPGQPHQRGHHRWCCRQPRAAPAGEGLLRGPPCSRLQGCGRAQQQLQRRAGSAPLRQLPPAVVRPASGKQDKQLRQYIQISKCRCGMLSCRQSGVNPRWWVQYSAMEASKRASVTSHLLGRWLGLGGVSCGHLAGLEQLQVPATVAPIAQRTCVCKHAHAKNS